MHPRVLILDRELRTAGLPLVRVARETVPLWSRSLTAAEQSRADAIVAALLEAMPSPAATDAQLAAWEATADDRKIDAVPDAVVDLILAAKALPPNATAAAVRERAKTDRRARRVRP